MITFQQLISRLNKFWEEKGCLVRQPYDIEKGAGTLNPETFLRCLGPEPYKTAYVEPSRRPTDGRYGENPNRVGHYYQYQVILKPSPSDIQSAYLESLEAIGLDLSKHDIRFVHDDWENPTIGAAGLGWEAWVDGMEVTQITYFQMCGGIPVTPVSGELTYGLERLAMYIQDVDDIFDIQWDENITYGDLYKHSEKEWSEYNFEEADTAFWSQQFDGFEKEATRLVEKKLPLPAYDFVMKASHAFNVMDARGAVSVTERNGYITRIRNLARGAASCYIESREEQGHPLLKSQVKSAAPTLACTVEEAEKALEGKAAEDFLLEIGCEELPATFVEKGLTSLRSLVEKLLKENAFSYEEIHTYATPRRLTLVVKNLACEKAAKKVEKKGPPLSRLFDEQRELTKAGEGFFRSAGGASPTLKQLQEGNCVDYFLEGEYLYRISEEPKRSAVSLLSAALPEILANVTFPKRMHWADYSELFARPIVWIVSLFGEQVVPFTYANVSASNKTQGHRQLAPRELTLNSPDGYLEKLREVEVIACAKERRALIKEQLEEIEKELDAKAVDSERVLDEVLYLVEKPLLTHATFDKRFLEVPKELLVSEMIEHQKYFPLAKEDGSLTPHFVITANNTPSDLIRKGNQKVLSARLSDGWFLYHQDLKTPLDSFCEKLQQITYQKKLGTMWDKVERLQERVRKLHPYFPSVNLEHALRAAKLCKADLASHAVFEFPELQGTMGKYFARTAGEAEEVAVAIEEHWMPTGEAAQLPHTPCGILLSIADKLDTLASCFAIGLKPTSSSDPYALRRQLFGIIKILLQNGLHLPLKELLGSDADLQAFLRSRVKTIFKGEGLSPDLIEAALSDEVSDIYDLFLRAKALQEFRDENTEEFYALYEVFKRARGQLQQGKAGTLSLELLQLPAEKALLQTIDKSAGLLTQQIHSKEYLNAFREISAVQRPLAKLFDEVQILDEDKALQGSRLALLQKVLLHVEQLIFFEKVQKL